MVPSPTRSITPQEVAERLRRGETILLIDVRRQDERAISVLPKDLHIPVDEVAARVDEVPREGTVVVYCRTGSRSGRVVHYLRGLGYTNVLNLQGGINAWADAVDPNMQKY
jgi:rhodanese-related sulfurtransferase